MRSRMLCVLATIALFLAVGCGEGQDAGDAASDAKDKVGSAVEQAKDAAGEQVDAAKQKVEEIVDEGAEGAMKALADYKAEVTEKISAYEGKLESLTSMAASAGNEELSGMVKSLGSRIEHLKGHITALKPGGLGDLAKQKETITAEMGQLSTMFSQVEDKAKELNIELPDTDKVKVPGSGH